MEKLNSILLLHGALGCKDQLNSLNVLLQQAGRTVYSMNFSGHGGVPFSDRGFNIEVFAGDVISFLNDHSQLRVDVFGYSMGGYVALQCCRLHPERIGSATTLGTKFDWDPATAAKEIRKMNPDKILEKIPAFARLLEARHAPVAWKELMQQTAHMMEGLGQSPLLTETVLKEIQHRVTILLGDEDDMADRNYSEHVSRCLPNAQFVLLEKTPHPIEKVDLQQLCQLINSNC